MKKIILLAIMAVLTTAGLHAEQHDVTLGAQFAYASRHSMAGLGVQLQYEPVTHLRLAPEFIYYFKNDNRSAYNLNLNVHYVIPTSSVFALYPLAGFSFGHYTVDGIVGDASTNRCGANVGLGAQYRIQDHLHFYTEQRFQIMKNFNQSVTLLGLKYTF